MTATRLMARRSTGTSANTVLPMAPRAFGFAAPRLHGDLLVQFAICLAPMPPAFLLGHSSPFLGQIAFFSGLGLLLAYHAIQSRPYHLLCLIVSCIPVLMLLRGIYIPYNSVVVLLGCGFACALVVPGEFPGFWKRKAIFYLILGSVFYWWISVLYTGDYNRNLRTVDWALCIAIVVMLSERRSYLRTAMLGWGISAAVGGLMLLPYGDRLGLAVIDGTRIGNPILLGVPCAFVLLLSIAENGKWILPQRHNAWRVVVGFVCGMFLVFSTSRGSWLIALVGLLILVICDRGSRLPILALGSALALTLMVLENSSHVQAANRYLMKVISPDTSMEVKTTGRIEQWRAFPAAFWDSPILGFGPGMSRNVSLAYSGENLVYHSLYLQIGAELGLVGLSVLTLLLVMLIRNGIVHFLRYGEIVPIIGTLSFLTMALSVTALDSLGGTLLGIGFIGCDYSNLWIVRSEFGVIRRVSRSQEPSK